MRQEVPDLRHLEGFAQGEKSVFALMHEIYRQARAATVWHATCL